MSCQIRGRRRQPSPWTADQCSITTANNDTTTGGCTAGSGADTIILQQDVLLIAALPEITSEVIIEGQGHKIDGNNGYFPVLRILSGGNLTLNKATITGSQKRCCDLTG
ncbi:hypothetical protein VU06_01870 [Desulfobulbus sp. F3]|nr:hypothetical protein [Desulfobulbus sp. F3]